MSNFSNYQEQVKNYFGLLFNDLQGENLDLLQFPASVFPLKIQTMIKDISGVAGYNVDMLSCSMLTAISAVIGNTRKVRLKSTHQDCANLFLLMVANPSSNKTRILKFALQPLQDLQRELELEHRKAKADYKKEMQMFRQNPKGNQPEEPEPLEELLLNDVNIETMFKMFDKNTRGLLYCADEFLNVLSYFDRDSFAESSFLELWNGGAKSRHRSQYKVTMPNVFLTLTGATQPVNIAKFGERNRNSTGFTSRFLFCYPNKADISAWTELEYEGDEKDFYTAIIRNIYNSRKVDANGHIQPHYYKFDEQAKKLVYEWQKLNTDLKNKATNNILIECYGKLDSYLLRLSLVLQTFTDFCEMNANNELVRVETVMNAIHLLEYFRRNYYKVQRDLTNQMPEALKKMSEAKKEIYKKLNDTFKTAELKAIGEFKYDSQVANFLNALLVGRIIRKANHGEYEKIYQL